MKIISVATDITILKMVKAVLTCLHCLILVILFITHNIPLLYVEQNIITIMLPDLAQTTPILNNFYLCHFSKSRSGSGFTLFVPTQLLGYLVCVICNTQVFISFYSNFA